MTAWSKICRLLNLIVSLVLFYTAYFQVTNQKKSKRAHNNTNNSNNEILSQLMYSTFTDYSSLTARMDSYGRLVLINIQLQQQ